MLHQQTVTPTCMAIIKQIMANPSFSIFRLVGGTALSLKYGHRTSDDIGLFSETHFDNRTLEESLYNEFGKEKITEIRDYLFGLFCNIDGIKSDFMFWEDEFIKEADQYEGIRIASDADIFAMKLSAAFDRKSKKDFIDIALFLEKYSLKQGLEWYKQKFPYNDELIPIKSLTYFDIADQQPDPYLFLHYNWQECKQDIINAVREYVEGETAGH